MLHGIGGAVPVRRRLIRPGSAAVAMAAMLSGRCNVLRVVPSTACAGRALDKLDLHPRRHRCCWGHEISAVRDRLDAIGPTRYAGVCEREKIKPEDLASLDGREFTALDLPLCLRERILKASAYNET